MQSYLGTEQSFTGDLHTLTKQGLTKALIAQMVAAGPTQGDALAQSILGDYGGVKAANATGTRSGKRPRRSARRRRWRSTGGSSPRT